MHCRATSGYTTRKDGLRSVMTMNGVHERKIERAGTTAAPPTSPRGARVDAVSRFVFESIIFAVFLMSIMRCVAEWERRFT
jgi:hypothetical protein